MKFKDSYRQHGTNPLHYKVTIKNPLASIRISAQRFRGYDSRVLKLRVEHVWARNTFINFHAEKEEEQSIVTPMALNLMPI